MLHINELDEIRQDALQRTMLIQNQRKKWHDKFIIQKQFNTGDWALLSDSRFKNLKKKLTTHWMSPYEVITNFDNGSLEIKAIDGSQVSFVEMDTDLDFITNQHLNSISYRVFCSRMKWNWLKGELFLLLLIL